MHEDGILFFWEILVFSRACGFFNISEVFGNILKNFENVQEVARRIQFPSGDQSSRPAPICRDPNPAITLWQLHEGTTD